MAFNRKKSTTNVDASTAIRETNTSTPDNRIAQQGSTQHGNVQTGNVGGSLVLTTNDASPEAIALVQGSLELQGNTNIAIANAAGRFGEAVLESNADAFESAADLSLKSQDRSLDFGETALEFGEKAIDSLSESGKQTTGFLTTLVDNVLARDAVITSNANFEGDQSAILRSLNEIGTTGSQANEKTQTLTIGITVAILGSGLIYFLVTRKKK